MYLIENHPCYVLSSLGGGLLFAIRSAKHPRIPCNRAGSSIVYHTNSTSQIYHSVDGDCKYDLCGRLNCCRNWKISKTYFILSIHNGFTDFQPDFADHSSVARYLTSLSELSNAKFSNSVCVLILQWKVSVFSKKTIVAYVLISTVSYYNIWCAI